MNRILAVILGLLVFGFSHLFSFDTELTPIGHIVQHLPTMGVITSPFGGRDHPIHHSYAMHTGVDIANIPASLIYSTGMGRVIRAERAGGYGIMVVVDHGHGWTSRYAHLQGSDVKVGDVVWAGAIIGRMGATGSTTGTHLHYELRHYDYPVDPMPHFEAATDNLTAYLTFKQ